MSVGVWGQDLKTGEGRPSVGSNPTLSANNFRKTLF